MYHLDNLQPLKKVYYLLILEFYKQPTEILVKVVDILENQGKAVKMDIGSDFGVKFL